ncbi:hypothetical protein FAIPA1_20458 [Frankia sp. AiPs1]
MDGAAHAAPSHAPRPRSSPHTSGPRAAQSAAPPRRSVGPAGVSERRPGRSVTTHPTPEKQKRAYGAHVLRRGQADSRFPLATSAGIPRFPTRGASVYAPAASRAR